MRGGGSKISLSLLMVSDITLQQPSCLLWCMASDEVYVQCLDCSNQLNQSNFLPFLLRQRLLQSNLLPPHPLSQIWPYVRFVSGKGNFRWDTHAMIQKWQYHVYITGESRTLILHSLNVCIGLAQPLSEVESWFWFSRREYPEIPWLRHETYELISIINVMSQFVINSYVIFFVGKQVSI